MIHKRKQKRTFRTKSKYSIKSTKKNKGGMFSLLSKKPNIKPEFCIGEAMNTQPCIEALKNKNFARKVQKLHDDMLEENRRSSLQKFMEEE